MNTPDPEPVDLSKLKPGPIRHESLTNAISSLAQTTRDGSDQPSCGNHVRRPENQLSVGMGFNRFGGLG